VNLLPWLLDWPPKRRTIVAFLLVTAVSVGTLLVFAPLTDQLRTENVTVETADLTVRLNDEQSLPEGEGVQTCFASGTPGERLGDAATVTVGMAHTEETTSGDIERTGGTFDVFWLLDDDETLSAGDTATLRVRVRGDGEPLATATQPVVVDADSRHYDY